MNPLFDNYSFVLSNLIKMTKMYWCKVVELLTAQVNTSFPPGCNEEKSVCTKTVHAERHHSFYIYLNFETSPFPPPSSKPPPQDINHTVSLGLSLPPCLFISYGTEVRH